MSLEVFAVGVAAFLDIFIGEEVRRARQRMADQRSEKEADKAEQAALTTEQQAEQARFAEAAQAYRQNLLDHHNRLRVFGKDKDDTLDDIFIDAYLLEKLTARERFDIRELHEQGVDLRVWSGRERERRNGMELVRSGDNLYLLGKPGAGKTTFLKWATVQAAQGKLPRVPIFVSLHDYTNSDHASTQGGGLLPFIAEQFADYGFDDPSDFIEGLLRSGEAMVLFDGLDEVRREDDQRQRLTRQLRSFATRYRRCQILITCRIAATEYDFVGFQTVEVADFTDEQVLAYAEKWFAQDEKVGAQKFKRFEAELTSEQNAAIKELCNSPLLLSMLCLDYDETMAFPTNRASLYRRALDVLLHRWDAKRGIQRDELTYRELESERKVEMFSRIAYSAFCEGKQFFDQADLEAELVAYLADLPNAPDPRDLDGTRVLKAVEAQHSILVERAREIYSFSHLTFQEYFAARYIVDNREDGTLDVLLKEGLTDRRWRETFLLTASLLNVALAKRFFFQMRSAIDELIADDKTLIELVAWANTKTRAANVPDEQCPAVRLAYVFLTLSFDVALALATAHRLISAVDLEFTRPIARASILARTRVLSDDLNSALDFIDISNNVDVLVEGSSTEVGIDYALLYAWQVAKIFANMSRFYRIEQHIVPYKKYLQQVVELCDEQSEDPLIEETAVLALPGADESQKSWRSFADKLEAFMHKRRNIPSALLLSLEQVDKINAYFAANELLVQCLNLAVVPNRREIEASLLLPPGAWSPPAA